MIMPVALFSILCHCYIYFLQHGETALHLVAKYNHPGVISAFNTFKVPMDIRGKVSQLNKL